MHKINVTIVQDVWNWTSARLLEDNNTEDRLEKLDKLGSYVGMGSFRVF